MRWLVAACVIAGCGGGEAFEIAAAEPGPDATGVRPDGVVQVTFSRDVDPATVDASSFRLGRGGAEVDGTVTYDEATRTATFAPARRLSLLAHYQAEVTSGVTDADGEPLPGSSWIFSIADGAWSPAGVLGSGERTEATGPQVAVDAAGNAIVVWKQASGDRTDIWANHYVADAGWATAAPIESDDAGSAVDPQVAADAAGNAIAVWAQSDGVQTSIWANRYTPGVGWGAAALVETDDGVDAIAPDVAIDATGNAIVVWEQAMTIRASRQVAGGGWDAPVALQDDPAISAWHPRIAINDAGATVAIWEHMPADSAFSQIAASRYEPGGGWSTAVAIESEVGTSIFPHAGVDPAGQATVVWSKYQGLSSRVWANRGDAQGGWATAQPIETDTDEELAFDPRVSVDAGGNAMVVWEKGLRIRSARYTADVGWSAAEPISDEGNGQAPRLALDADGNAVAVWADRSFILANRYVVGAGWLGVDTIEIPVAGAAETADLAVDPGGNVVAVWNHLSEDMQKIDVLGSTFR